MEILAAGSPEWADFPNCNQRVNPLGNWWALCPTNRVQIWVKAMKFRSRALPFWQQLLEAPDTPRVRQQMSWENLQAHSCQDEGERSDSWPT